MSLSDLTFARWRTLDTAAAARFAEEAARRVDGSVLSVDATAHLGGTLHRAVIERDGERYALVPGGEVTVGFDVEAWEPSPNSSSPTARRAWPAGSASTRTRAPTSPA
ncbi:hypothetical protein ACFT39_20310 [[Kitasatospora] papulosa]|uniref:hypothetical protein n=1 Tax=[Kitasatospora] papulosa TaxID=1464011 RepID=UPI00362FBF9B